MRAYRCSPWRKWRRTLRGRSCSTPWPPRQTPISQDRSLQQRRRGNLAVEEEQGRNTVVVGVALADFNQPIIEVTEGIRIGDIVNQDGYTLEIELANRHTCVTVLEVERADLLESFLS